MKMTVNLSPKEVEEIVKVHLLTKFKTVGPIKLEVSKDYVGYHEATVLRFKGATTEVEL